MIKIPDLRQRTDYSCGEAAVDAVFMYFGLSTRCRKLSTPYDGMHPSTAEALLRKAGLSVVSGTMDIDDLRYHVRRGRPVLCPIDAYGGHWVVVFSVGPRSITYHCPLEGREKIAHRQWLSMWEDSTRVGHPFRHWGIACYNER